MIVASAPVAELTSGTLETKVLSLLAMVVGEKLCTAVSVGFTFTGSGAVVIADPDCEMTVTG